MPPGGAQWMCWGYNHAPISPPSESGVLEPKWAGAACKRQVGWRRWVFWVLGCIWFLQGGGSAALLKHVGARAPSIP